MRVLLLGATGNLGLRLIPSLLSHSHSVIAYVRSPDKLQLLLPANLHEQITVIQGDATDPQAIKSAIIDNKCEGVVSTAGVAALAPWASSDLPEIFRAVVEAAREAGSERETPLRVWMMGGQGVLQYPGGRPGEMLCK
jgi:nucleoside-diphosphate-sugar epimerase